MILCPPGRSLLFMVDKSDCPLIPFFIPKSLKQTNMTQFESGIKMIPYSQEQVYAKLSDLNHLEAVKDRIPADKIEDLRFDADSVSFNVSPVGRLSLRIVDREPLKTIKFEAENSPIPFNLWIQLLPVTETECKMKLTIKAEINMFLKGMVSKPMQDGLEKLAEMLAVIPYNG